MKLKKLFTAILIAFIAFTLTACNNKKNSNSNNSYKVKIRNGGNIIFSIDSSPEILNPLYSYDRATMTINNAIFSPLFTIHGEKIDYYLADNITHSKDYLTYTLKLKKNLKWHDGKPLTVDDIVFTMEKIMDKRQNTFLRELFIINNKPITVKKINNDTIEFKLPSIQMAFLNSLSQVSPIPKHVFSEENDIQKSSKNNHPIGSGPFKFKNFNKNKDIVLERFDNYFGGKAHLDSITYKVLKNKNSIDENISSVENHARYIKPKDIKKFKDSEHYNIITFEEGMVDGIILNCIRPNLNKKEVRQAIAYSLNKEGLLKAGYESEKYAQKAYNIFPINTLYYNKNINKYKQNKNMAKDLLKKTNIKNITLSLVYVKSNKPDKNKALVVQKNLKDIGINVELKPLDKDSFIQEIFIDQRKNYDFIFNGYIMGYEPDSYKDIFMTDKQYNTSNYSNKEVDDLWTKASIETDKSKRKYLYKDIQNKIIDDMPIYPIANPKSIIAISKKIGGIKEAKPVPIFMFQDLSKLYIIEN
ncbi:ABC transporter substrate-binding protein [Clostridium niameyense]|uniref:ABC transporter substrate-binding protein n=1 Tax=Clostridium niameyense TaxID=1622073 RepID=A0A6M0RAV2_9CLOT|nr:ABC transporter substrate-binding protein [Clostridium niameyense]NEZ46877.1 ABC transporter substrate-binding protein [Clostridium niameyense]